jgi:YidC/Oxa1 family membrane protein insertase
VLAFVHRTLRPVEDAVSAILLQFHALGLDWPLAIVALVVLARAVLLPLFVLQVRSARRTTTVRPRLAEIGEKYRGRTDPASRRAHQEELLAAHREAGANPLAGCLPVLLQSPVFLALTLTLESGSALPAAATLLGVPLAAVPTADPGALAIGLLLVAASAVLQAVTMLLADQRPPTLLLVGVPVVVAATTVHFPVGVLLYWATSAAWSAGQQAVARQMWRRSRRG